MDQDSKHERAYWGAQVLALANGEPCSAPESLRRQARAHSEHSWLAPEPPKHPSPFQGTARAAAGDCLARALAFACEDAQPPGMLVFCSAKRPGGGWLSGARAQEESVSRRTTWGARCHEPAFHDATHPDSFYGDDVVAHLGLVVSPEEGQWMEVGVQIAMAGFAAPNLRALREKGGDPLSAATRQRCRRALLARCERALSTFEAMGCLSVVLGAIGCGVFEVDPEDAAQAWKDALAKRGGSIQRIEFALGPAPSMEISLAFASLERAGGPASFRKGSRQP